MDKRNPNERVHEQTGFRPSHISDSESEYF